MWRGDFVGACFAHSEFECSSGARCFVRGADDYFDCDFAGDGHPQNGGIAGADGIDRSYKGGESFAGEVCAAAHGFGRVGERSVTGRNVGVVLDGARRCGGALRKRTGLAPTPMGAVHKPLILKRANSIENERLSNQRSCSGSCSEECDSMGLS